MSKADLFKNLVNQLTESLPGHLGSLKKDFEKNCHRILVNSFEKFDLVTREEFDTQTKVLARTRKKLEELEGLVKKLEIALKSSRTHPHDKSNS